MVQTEETQMTSQYGAYALYAGLPRSHAPMRMHTPTRQGTHTHERARMNTQTNVYYLFLSHGDNGFANSLQYYVIRTFPFFLPLTCRLFTEETAVM